MHSPFHLQIARHLENRCQYAQVSKQLKRWKLDNCTTECNLLSLGANSFLAE